MLQRRLLLTLLPAALLTAGAVLWLLPRTAERGASQAESSTPIDAEFDYFITQMKRVTFSAEGLMVNTLKADRVVNYPAGDRAELEHPDMVWYETDAAPWMLIANAGTLRGAGTEAEDLLELRDQVELKRPLQDGTMFVARTSRLDAVIPTREFATDQPVTLETGDMHMDSIGMRGNLFENRVELLEDVRGRHAPIATR
jgi:lipopolysaccharide export system protein LptC